MVSFLRTFVVLCIIAGVLLQGGTAQAPPRAVRSLETKFNSVTQACRGVLETECPSDGLARTDCLMEHIVDNANHECKMWLSWRATCFAYATVYLIPQGKCNFKPHQATSELIRNCLRNTDKSELPAVCAGSPYYRSLMLRASRRMDSDAAADL
ncbi:hypothetical protein, unknown function [Leishmania mexicana MHOM/GT/2001/U1103]|uniref:Uncharacterized protein n=1 Tax=Leishmania mexicana (strain MHOM/GT/2001/U1103) TaxID=929439 RepID=E9ASM9_LEIMU|nr:hypothetical protein, unknown function [Leishmania mexicana MHOM/GT/2001/U1103]CBZ25952.1 hypothetical protein, unknown function [Leishmania mexicana MHOM/GT/2001/U1103]